MTLIIDLVPLQEVDERDNEPSTSSAAATSRTLSVFLVQNAANAASLRAEILSQTTSPRFDASFIDATLVPSLDVLQTAAAMASQSLPVLKTKTLQAELLWSLGGTKQIGRALSTFGIKDDSVHVLVAKFDATEEEMAVLRGAVEGGELVEGREAIDLKLGALCDVGKVKAQYKISDLELEIGSVVESVIGRIAARDCGPP